MEKHSEKEKTSDPSTPACIEEVDILSLEGPKRVYSIFDLDQQCFFTVTQNLSIKDRVRLKLVCKKWRDELNNKTYWEKLDFYPISSLLDQRILKHFCKTTAGCLTSLNLKNCFQITDAELKGVSLTCVNVTTLSLSNCWPVTDRGIKYIARNVKGITSLDISYCSQVHGIGFENHKWSNLRFLSISYCKSIGDDELELVLSRAPELRVLHARRCKKITDFGIFTMARFCRLLSRLDLGDCEVTEKTLQWISTGCQNLTSLNLTFCLKINFGGITDVSLALKNLRHIRFDHCTQLSDNSVLVLLAEAGPITHLSLRGCKKVTQGSIFKLVADLKNLVELDMSSCPQISEDSVKALLKMSPKLDIKFDTHYKKNIGKRAANAKIAGEVSLRERYTNIPKSSAVEKKVLQMDD